MSRHLSRNFATLRARGVSMVELLVALAIGSVLIAGAVFVYSQSRNSYGVNETVARLQETARYAMSVIEPDVRMSSFWGLVNDPELINGRARQGDAVAAVASGAPANACGNNYAVDLYTTVEGSDGAYALNCDPGTGADTAQAETDTLTVRRASSNASAAAVNRLQVWTTRTTGRLFSDGVAPGALAPTGQINDLIVDSYYVAADSDGRAAIPSLRRQMLIPGPAFQDQEIVTGVEDMQVQFGIDPNGVLGIATRYVDPGTALPVGAQVVAVRVWILVRADQPEVGFVDNRTYTMGNRIYQPNDAFRRVLLTRTIQVRNSLG